MKVSPMPLPALCEGLHRWDHHSLGDGESKIWMCLSFYLLYPAQCLALGSGSGSRHLVKFWSRHCLVPDHARATSPLVPGSLPHLSDGDKFPSGDEEMVRGVSEFTPPKAPRGIYLARCCQHSINPGLYYFHNQDCCHYGGQWLFIK